MLKGAFSVLGLVLIMAGVSAPVSLCLILLAQTLLCALLSWVYLAEVWAMIVLLLVFFGGVMVLFMYVATLAMNEQTSVWAGLSLLSAGLVMASPFIWSGGEDVSFNSGLLALKQVSSGWGVLLISYLLYCLILVVKSAKIYLGPFRSS